MPKTVDLTVRVVALALFAYFLYKTWSSIDRLRDGKIGTAETTEMNVQVNYPSLTLCLHTDRPLTELGQNDESYSRVVMDFVLKIIMDAPLDDTNK